MVPRCIASCAVSSLSDTSFLRTLPQCIRSHAHPRIRVKHEFGTPNPIIMTEERSILSTVDRAVASSGNAQVIGRNGELPLRNFLSRYLPPTLRAETGHFLSPSGELSPQQDVMILDARYPLLASNPDGSVLAMLHGVLSVLELKTTLRTRDLMLMWRNAIHATQMAAEVPEFSDGFAGVRVDAMAYRLDSSLAATERAYIKAAEPDAAGLDLYVMRLSEADQPPRGEIGAFLHFEPLTDEDAARPTSGDYEKWMPICLLSHTILSDIYYRTVQDSYYALSARGWSFGDIGEHVMKYMTWATLSWDAYAELVKS